ncbi:MAG: primosomal protein N' [Gammaproteobacteria bacterium]|nr:primosomal protein N' [Gammaproteobacteria bacterium]
MKYAYFRIAIPTPLRRYFDYLAPANIQAKTPQPGVRVKVPFGRQTLVGILLDVVHETDVPGNKLKPVIEVLDELPVFDSELLQLLRWCSAYYHHPIGEVMQNALPVKLRQGANTHIKGIRRWQITPEGETVEPQSLKRAAKQIALLGDLKQASSGLLDSQLSEQHVGWHPVMKRLQEKGWVKSVEENALPIATPINSAPVLNPDQQHAINRIIEQRDHFHAFVLEGVTGSGKTEVYLQVIEDIIKQGKQALVLVPEIGLTPQLFDRFLKRLDGRIAIMHSGLNDEERLQAWLNTQAGSADVIIGTRSAVFSPLLRPGIIIIDEEHDLSFKQQDGFRYSARDLAVKRARDLNIPIVLGSATPSLETLYNALQHRYETLLLPERAGEAKPPVIHLLDVRSQKMEHGISAQLLHKMKEHLERDSQVLLFLNRRGFAPVLMCHECGWHALCPRCDAHMTLHQSNSQLRCHHCGTEQYQPKVCPKCHSEDLLQMGFGTERIEQALNELFPHYHVIRIDRDSTRRKGSMQKLLTEINNGKRQILIGTQMLAKGHHFPNVTLVAMLNADHGLYSSDFRASERMGQLILQVAGRAGREEKEGEVLIQTHHPDHPLFTPLLKHDYPGFAESLIEERQQTELPPFTHLALLRAEAVDQKSPMVFLEQARLLLEQVGQVNSANQNDVMLMGPFPALMERRAGRYRAQLLIQANSRKQLQALFASGISQIEKEQTAKKVRWSIDIDPQDLM